MKIKALLCFSLLFSQVTAVVRPEPCRFGIQGEYLCLKSRSEQSDFAVLSTDSGNSNKIINNQGDFKSGFRVEGIYSVDPIHDVRLRITYFHPGGHLREVSGTISDPFLPDDVPFTGSAIPTDEYAMAAVVVIRLEHQLVIISSDEIY